MALKWPSDSGKTTLFNLLDLLDRPDAGPVRTTGTALEVVGAPRAATAKVLEHSEGSVTAIYANPKRSRTSSRWLRP